jgi:hypothetical protein
MNIEPFNKIIENKEDKAYKENNDLIIETLTKIRNDILKGKEIIFYAIVKDNKEMSNLCCGNMKIIDSIVSSIAILHMIQEELMIIKQEQFKYINK